MLARHSPKSRPAFENHGSESIFGNAGEKCGLAALSDKVQLEVYNFLLEKEKVAEYAVDKVPPTLVRNGKDYGIRFFGLPAGYEFSTLLDAILAVSKGDSGLQEESREKLRQVTQPLHLQVFVTPT